MGIGNKSDALKKTFKNWLYVDTRTLALFRIYFGFIGLIDVLRRYGVIEVFYSDTGMNFRRQVTNVKLWKLSEKSPDIDTPDNERPKVRKRELKKTQKGAQKRKKKVEKSPRNNLKLK